MNASPQPHELASVLIGEKGNKVPPGESNKNPEDVQNFTIKENGTVVAPTSRPLLSEEENETAVTSDDAEKEALIIGEKNEVAMTTVEQENDSKVFKALKEMEAAFAKVKAEVKAQAGREGAQVGEEGTFHCWLKQVHGQ